MKNLSTALITLLISVLPGIASAQSFSCISAGAQCAAAESDVSWSFSGNNLTISNQALAGNDSFIRSIYFDTSAGMGVSLVGSTDLSAFVVGGAPSNLPAGSNVGFVADSQWTATNPAPTYGINAGESITFSLSGVTASSFSDGSLRFGVHLQGLPGGASESLVSAVPEPQTYAMLLAGLGLLGFTANRRRQSFVNAY
jgi:hypothetical protein